MKNMMIADMAEHEKPVEKLIKYGAESLSDAELLACILRTGTRDMNVISLAQLILNSGKAFKGIRGLNYQSYTDLVRISGVGNVKAAQLLALVEVSKRISTLEAEEKLIFDSPESVANYFMEEVRYLTKERVYALFLSSSDGLLHKSLLSEGSINRSIVSSRELFKEALRYEATNIILIHNHPSGDPTPSTQDIILTRQILELSYKMGIPLLDHIIIGDKRYVSLAEEGYIQKPDNF
ncbi:MAG: DNA repair protein RadC [Eubacterium sp.]|nr:DNA repair protein RadC [Eubacterium sp.]